MSVRMGEMNEGVVNVDEHFIDDSALPIFV
jgi:hypothetical protein